KTIIMREDKHRRKYRHRPTRTGADVVRKEAIGFDACETFQIYGMHVRDWKTRNQDSAALFRPDPFGVNDYFVEYSLNKKKRWTMKEEIKDRIEEVQDQSLNLRVSASVHGIDRSNIGYTRNHFDQQEERLPCLEYHTVSRDGKTVTHKEAEHGRARLRNFTHAAQPPRKQGKGKRAGRYYERYDWNDRNLAVDEKVEHQKLHVHYTIEEHSDRPSLHNKEASQDHRSHRKHSAERRQSKASRKHSAAIEIPSPEDVLVEADDLSPVAIVEEIFPIPTVVEDLGALVVRKEKKKKTTGKREPLRRFVDELLKSPFFMATPATSGYGSEDDFDDDEPSTSFSSLDASIQLVSLPSEMFTRLSLSSIPHLSSATRLPCFPPAWEVHQRDSLHVLGKYLLTCVVARQYGDELRLAIVDDCASTHPSRPQLPPSDEPPPEIDDAVEGDFCEICYGEMDLTSDDRLCHPFSLSCSHLFCTGCWMSHISESIRRQRLPAACLHPDCSYSVSVSAAKGILSSSSIEVYELATIDALKAAEKLITCPECKRLHFTKGSLHISCPCGASLCAHCSSVDHSPLGCDVFDQYNSYMKRSGFTSVYSTSSEAPIIRNLAKCPKCSALMQRSEGCNHMTCACGMEFCYCCGNKWSSSHYSCSREEFTKMTMVDVFTARQSPLLVPSLLTLAIEARTVLIDRRKELQKRLRLLPFLERKAIERTFVQLSLIVELCYLSSRRRRSARFLADRVRFWLEDFYNTKDKNIADKGRSLKELRDSLAV
ncbi:hypothetical protein PRIPAC_71519, partial [Pristionchus pacificus]